jgi:hypothetical protein
MHARFALLAVCLLFVLPAGAVTLDDLRRTLAEFKGDVPIRVKIDSTLRRGEGKEKKESAGTSVAEDDGASVRLVYDKSELRKHAASKSPVAGDHSVTAHEALQLMNFGPPMLKMLEGATLKKVTSTTLDGAAATLLEIVPLREKDEDGDKWIKAYADTLLVWLGPGNVPVAAERTMKIKARIVVIGVEFNKKEKFRFARMGERLVVGARSSESSSAGLGKSETEFRTAKVVVVR